MFDRPGFGWLPWALGVSKKIFITGNVLTIRWSLIVYIEKYMFEKIFPIFHCVPKNLKNITLKELKLIIRLRLVFLIFSPIFVRHHPLKTMISPKLLQIFLSSKFQILINLIFNDTGWYLISKSTNKIYPCIMNLNLCHNLDRNLQNKKICFLVPAKMHIYGFLVIE